MTQAQWCKLIIPAQGRYRQEVTSRPPAATQRVLGLPRVHETLSWVERWRERRKEGREEWENKGRKEEKKELERNLFLIIKTRTVSSLTHALSEMKTIIKKETASWMIKSPIVKSLFHMIFQTTHTDPSMKLYFPGRWNTQTFADNHPFSESFHTFLPMNSPDEQTICP